MGKEQSHTPTPFLHQCQGQAGSRCPAGRRQGHPGHLPAGQSYYEEQNGTNVQLVPEVTEVQGRHLLQATPIGIVEELLRRPQLGEADITISVTLTKPFVGGA